MIPYHVATIYPKQYLFLQRSDSSFHWLKMNPSFDEGIETPCQGETLARAIQAAYKMWQADFFTLLNCGFRYSLPVRDQTGCSAFFWQMAKSYSTPNGHYFDEEAGHLCFVDFASTEALAIWRKIR